MGRGKAETTLVLEQAILEIVNERAPITIRGIGYVLFTRGLIPSMAVGQTAKVSRIATDMRERGTMDWRQIVDDSRPVQVAATWHDPDELIAASTRDFRRDQWQDQPHVVELWSEKGTVGGVLQPVLDEFGVTFRVMRGFSSFTKVAEVCEQSQDKKIVALYCGDHDPSGMFMNEVDLPARIRREGGRIQLKRVALQQRDTRRLPDFAAKPSDPRHRWYVRRYGRRAWEVDAMDPRALRQRMHAAIERHIDHARWDKGRRIEQAQIESMHAFYDTWRGRLKTNK